MRTVARNLRLRELCRLIKQGDEQAFNLFYKETSSNLWRYLSRYFSNVSDIDDILHRTYERIWISRQYLSDVDYPMAYLTKTAGNFIHSKLKERKKRSVQYVDFNGQFNSVIREVELKANVLPQSILECTNALIYNIEHKWRLAIAALPPQQREVYNCVIVHEYSYKQTAAFMNLTAKTVSNYLEIAQKKVRAAVNEGLTLEQIRYTTAVA